jgi:hypothetical protein
VAYKVDRQDFLGFLNFIRISLPKSSHLVVGQ